MYYQLQKINQGIKKSAALALGSIMFASVSIAQTKAKLEVGDPAPAIKYSKVLKGNPKFDFQDGKIYVVEFWATWCGPCIAAMPHLSDLSEKYAKEAVFVGANVMEKVGQKPYESSLPAVEKFVKSQAKRLRYNVIADNNANDLENNWLKAASINGIPSSFVVHKGKIAWIGHPMGLDSILPQIVEGKFDIVATKAKTEASEAEGNQMMQAMQTRKMQIDSAEKAGNYDKAIQLADDAMAAMPNFKFVFSTEKFRILLDHVSEDKAIAYGNEILKGTVGIQALAAMLIEKEPLSQKMKEYAVVVGKSMKADNPFVYNFVAALQAKAGMFKDAAESQRKALADAELKKNDPQLAGFLTNEVLKEYKEKLAEYEKQSVLKK